MLRRPVLAGLIVLAATAAPAPAQDRRARGDLAIQARDILRRYCGECHGPDYKTSPAQTGLGVLDHRQLVNRAAGRQVTFVPRDGASTSHLLELIECGSMPPGGRTRPTEDEIGVLRKWLAARAPSYPQAFDDRTTLAVMLDDLDQIRAGTLPPPPPGQKRKWPPPTTADIPYVRYLSLAHLVQDGQALPNLRAAEFKLHKALIKAGMNSQDAPEPVDDTATLFRFDVRSVGWDARDLFTEMNHAGDPLGGVSPLIPYDLILLEYPHGFTLPEKDPFADGLQKYLTAAKQAGLIRPVAFVRADWLTDALVKEVREKDDTVSFEDQPLGEELKSLVALKAGLDAGKLPRGPKLQPLTPRWFPAADPIRVAGFADGRRPLPPFGALYARDVAPDPAPFELTARIVGEGGKPIDVVRTQKPDLYWIELQAQKDAHFLVLVILADGGTRVQEVLGGSKLTAGQSRQLRPPNQGAFRLVSRMSGQDEVVCYVVFAAEAEIRPECLTIVRSKHAEPYVHRFVFDPAAGGLDPQKVVRKVLPLRVTL
jgi:hypothetical protein